VHGAPRQTVEDEADGADGQHGPPHGRPARALQEGVAHDDEAVIAVARGEGVPGEWVDPRAGADAAVEPSFPGQGMKLQEVIAAVKAPSVGANQRSALLRKLEVLRLRPHGPGTVELAWLREGEEFRAWFESDAWEPCEATLGAIGIAPAGTATSSFRITWMVPDGLVKDAVRALHERFIEKQRPLLP